MNAVNPSGLESWIKSSRILVTVGSGGVGKTTSSIALALLGARLGLRVGLLSIDPAGPSLLDLLVFFCSMLSLVSLVSIPPSLVSISQHILFFN